jgi:hypothetical protein
MVLVGNHHPSSSHIINQKSTKTFEQHIKNTHVKKNQKNKTQPDVLNIF